MADQKISQLASGAPAQGTDETIIARSGANFKLAVSDIVGVLGSPVTVANGGTGQSSYTNGQLLIGNSTGNTLSKATLTAGSGISITNGSGAITIAATGGTGTVTSVSGTGTVSGLTLTGTVTSSGNLTLGGTLSVNLASNVTGTLPVANGGTGLTSGTSGGVLAFTASGTIASSGALAANAIVVGGGAGVAPSTTTTGTGVLTALGVNVGSSGAFTTNNAVNTFTAAQTFRAANAVRSEAAATQDAVVLAGRAGGTSSHAVTLTPTTLSASRTMTLPNADTTVPVFTQVITFSGPSAARTVTLPDENFTVGFRNVPQSGSDKTSSYTLVTGDVGKFVGVGASGSITVPNSTFAAGDVVSIFNNTSGNVTLTMSITTAYIAGTDADKDTITLATRGVATILFISGTVCVVTGNVS